MAIYGDLTENFNKGFRNAIFELSTELSGT